jgi:hypothetical protein
MERDEMPERDCRIVSVTRLRNERKALKASERQEREPWRNIPALSLASANWQ